MHTHGTCLGLGKKEKVINQAFEADGGRSSVGRASEFRQILRAIALCM